MSGKRFGTLIFLGALLIAGLFFVWPRFAERSRQPLKPSDIDFARSNQPVVMKTPGLSTAGTAASGGEAAAAVSVSAVAAPEKLSVEDKKRYDVFEQILVSKNDNDPRMDSELGKLSPELHRALRDRYQTLAVENRNGRGAIAFLIARDLQSVADVDFLKSIYQESPCLGFKNCAVAEPQDPHMSGIQQTSLDYPQLAALYQLDRRLDADPTLAKNPEFRKAILDLIREARQFPSNAVQARAEQISKKL